MKLTKTTCKNGNIHYYLALSKIINGKSTTQVYKKLGDLYSLMEQMDCTAEEVEAWCQTQKQIETKAYRDSNKPINIMLYPQERIELNVEHNFNLGYLILQSIFTTLHLDQTCSKIRRKENLKYDLDQILRHLVYNRILSTNSDSTDITLNFVEKKSYKPTDVEHAFNVLSKYLNAFQIDLFNTTKTLLDNKPIYYYQTNQIALFTTANGIPFAFHTQNQQQPLDTFLEDKIIVCNERDLPTFKEQFVQSEETHNYLSTQPLNNLSKEDQTAALRVQGWKRVTTNQSVSIKEIEEFKSLKDGVYSKEIPNHTNNHRTIVVFSTNYAHTQDINTDAFYVLHTNLDKKPRTLIELSEKQWKIQQNINNAFNHLESQNNNQTHTYFLIDLLAFYLTQTLQLQLKETYSIQQIVNQLNAMNTTLIADLGYAPSYTRTKLTDALQDLAGLSLDQTFIKTQTMKKLVKQSKEH